MIQEKFIDGYDGKYSVNTSVEVFSFVGAQKRQKSQAIGSHRYYVVGLYKKKTKSILVHRLVAMAFIPNPESKPQVNHINGIRTDNRIENLEWCTNGENQIHSYKKLGKQTESGEKNHKSKQVIQFGLDGITIGEYESMHLAEKKLGIARTTISRNCRGLLPHAGGFKWEYKSNIITL